MAVAYSTPPYNVTLTFAGGPPGIGFWAETQDNGFLGALDELSVYNRALSQSEIQGIYNAGSGGKCFTPVSPVIASQPTNQTVMVGQSASFSVLAGGTPPFGYGWSFNTTNIVGATNATLTLPSVQLTNAGLCSARKQHDEFQSEFQCCLDRQSVAHLATHRRRVW